jgi:prolyl-tRNA synthetase
MLRLSRLFVRTLREAPADAELPGHAALVRAGYIRRAGSGLYTWLPLGRRVERRVERIVREELERIGAQEVHFPALLPREPYEASGRWDEYGDTLFRLTDRRGHDHLLAPTHEEMFTLLVKDLCSSYKDLPLLLYQVQHKYRDEARPRAGLLRAREFAMKDSYSFDVDDAGLAASYQRHREAYIAIFDRLGLEHVIVSAVSGAMGGSRSEEFLCPTPVGEDTFVRTAGGYAANVEAVITPPPDHPFADEDAPAAHVEDTPGTPTIDTLVAFANEHHPRTDGRPWRAADTLKNVVVMLRQPDGTRTPLVIGVPGDREVDPKRLQAQVDPAVVEPFTDEDFAAHPLLVRGYLGPQVLGDGSASAVRYLVDPRVVDGTRWLTGANEPGRHVFDLVCGRDFTPDGTIEAAEVRSGDPAPDGSGPLELARGIELGHIFQLGRRYAEALGLEVLDRDGKLVTVTMGSYGIGVSRAVAAIAETTVDDDGLCWPRQVAPADVHIVLAGTGTAVSSVGERLAAELEAAGIEVLLDDRPRVSAGVRFADAELLGVPTIVVVGKRLVEGVIEVKERRSGERTDVPVGEAVDHLVAVCRGRPHHRTAGVIGPATSGSRRTPDRRSTDRG